MEATSITDKQFWIDYWKSKDFNIKLTDKPAFYTIFDEIISKQNTLSCLEIGGFPGYYSIYIKNKFPYSSTTLFDFVIVKEKLKELYSANNIKESAIQVLEGDINTFTFNTKYDFVFSLGFIEHFYDTKFVIQKHIDALNDNGSLLITLPNFRGINGFINKKFDIDNYNAHNIKCMDINFLKHTCEELKLSSISVSYYGGFSIWLEDMGKLNSLNKLFFYTLKFVGKAVSKIIPLKNRLFSPYIIIRAKR
ncbi:MAG: class I SAM-dependent methyltransferase [Bacteroidetes bacterium]|nr:class I SAM-dependent methyltransferase [Bacteroidota bacterium]